MVSVVAPSPSHVEGAALASWCNMRRLGALALPGRIPRRWCKYNLQPPLGPPEARPLPTPPPRRERNRRAKAADIDRAMVHSVCDERRSDQQYYLQGSSGSPALLPPLLLPPGTRANACGRLHGRWSDGRSRQRRLVVNLSLSGCRCGVSTNTSSLEAVNRLHETSAPPHEIATSGGELRTYWYPVGPVLHDHGTRQRQRQRPSIPDI